MFKFLFSKADVEIIAQGKYAKNNEGRRLKEEKRKVILFLTSFCLPPQPKEPASSAKAVWQLRQSSPGCGGRVSLST